MFVLSEPMFTVALYCFNYGYFVPRTTTMMAMTTVRQPIRQGTATGWRIFGQWVMFNHARLGSVRSLASRCTDRRSQLPNNLLCTVISASCTLDAFWVARVSGARSRIVFLRFALEALARVVRFGPCLPRARFRCVWFFIEIFFMLAIIPFELRCVLLLSLLSSVESICQFVIAGRNVFILVG